MEETRKVAIGTIKWFDEAKGLGFIKQEDDEDVYFDLDIVDDVAELEPDRMVQFIKEPTDTGPIAREITILR
jgi:cold shock CspA family protein